MSESAMGKLATNNRPVRCIELKKVFNSARQAALYYNVAPPTITRVCQGIKPTAVGFHWCYEDQYNIEMEKIFKFLQEASLFIVLQHKKNLKMLQKLVNGVI